MFRNQIITRKYFLSMITLLYAHRGLFSNLIKCSIEPISKNFSFIPDVNTPWYKIEPGRLIPNEMF